MRVNEYIYRNWANWNFAILKQLCEDEEIEWNEKLVKYLKTTPTNTNWSMLVNFGIEPYGSDGEEESGSVYELWYWHEGEEDDYPISKSIDERNTYVIVSHPNKILGKKYDIYYWQDAETGANIYALSGNEFSEYHYSYKIDNFEGGETILDGDRNYIRYTCEMSSDYGEGWSEDGEVRISEPYDEEDSESGTLTHYPGIIKFVLKEPQE